MAYETILVETGEGIGTVTLSRPDVLNAFNDAMTTELQGALKALERDGEVRALILTGAGRAFCAGQDLQSIKGKYAGTEPPHFGDDLRKRYHPIITRLRTTEKPIVAAVNGVAAGAGCSLALACDLIVASEKASFIEVFAKVGLVPDSGSTFFLPRLVGFAKAMELCLLAEPMEAQEALRIGLINKVVAPDQLLPAAREWAAKLASGPTKAFGLAKRALNRSLANDLEAQLEYEAYCQEIAGRTQDHREGVLAFLEKRKPTYTGR